MIKLFSIFSFVFIAEMEKNYSQVTFRKLGLVINIEREIYEIQEINFITFQFIIILSIGIFMHTPFYHHDDHWDWTLKGEMYDSIW